MNPTTTRPQISAEGLAAKGRIAEFRQNVNNGATSAEARKIVRQIEAGPQTSPKVGDLRSSTGGTKTYYTASNINQPPRATGFKVDLPPTVPSEALNGNVGVADVRARRDSMEQQNLATEQFNTDYGNLMGRVQAPLGATPFQNPQQFIEETLLRRPTATDTALNERSQAQAEGFRGLAEDVEKTRQQTRDELGVVDLQSNLAETRNRIAERTNQLRTTLRDFETNAERRGVAREFVDSEKGKVQADAAAELADLAIIESAQAGNLQMAQEDIDRAVNAKIQAFEFENAAIETEIKRLEQVDTKESQARSEQLQIALGERNRLIEQAVADERQKLEYLNIAAANGGDQGTLDAIRKSTNVGEAALLAGPFIGRVDRLNAEASRASSYASARASNASAAINEYELIAAQQAENDAASGLLTPEQAKTANEVNKDFEGQPIVKSYNEGLQRYLVLEDTLANGIDGIQDLQLVYDFMKAVDPTSVVREQEFDNAAKTGNIFEGAYAKYNKNFGSGGFLPENVKSDFIRAARSSFEAKNSQYYNVKSEYAKRMNNTVGTSNGADYLTAYEAVAPLTEEDVGVANVLQGASPEEIQDIMLKAEQISNSNGYIGVTRYK